MYYAFIDGHYFGSSRHLAYLKNQVDEDIEVINAFHATIYRGERSYCSRFYDGTWKLMRSEKKDRPELPDWSYAKRSRAI